MSLGSGIFLEIQEGKVSSFKMILHSFIQTEDLGERREKIIQTVFALSISNSSWF